MSQQTSVSVRAYRFLLGAYPRAFRDRYGQEMEAAFVCDRQRAGRSAFFWLTLLSDTAANAAGEQLRRMDPWRRRPVFPNLSKTPHKSPIEMMYDLLRDVRYAVRTLRRTPGYTAIVLTVLALGIGANTVVFTVVNTLFFTTPTAIDDPSSLLRITRTLDERRSRTLSYPNYEVMRDRNRTFTGIAAYDPETRAVTAARPGAAERLTARAIFATGNYFEVLGVTPQVGRLFDRGEDAAPGEAPVTVLSDSFWRRVFGGNREVVGQLLTLNGHSFTVVGVAPPGFSAASPLEDAPDLWIPVVMRPTLSGGDNGVLIREENNVSNWLLALGRTRPGVSLEQAQADLDAVTVYLEEEYAEWNEGQGTAVTPHFMYQPSDRAELIGFAQLLAAVVGVVLLIVCANVAVLQLVRASRRQQELSVRAALGAGRIAVVRQLLIESLVLSIGGAALGLLAATWLAGLAASMLPVSLNANFQPDGRVLLFSMGAAMFTALLSGMAPALSASRVDVMRTMQSRGVASGRSPVRSALVVAQVALSVMLVTGAALFVRSLLVAESVDPGFQTENRVLVSLNPSAHGYSAEETDTLTREVLERLQSTSAVASASATLMSPFSGAWTSTFEPFDDGSGREVRVRGNGVAPGYFETMGIELLAGRDFDFGDTRDRGRVLVLNQAAADELWPDDNPLGKMIAFRSDEPVDRVIGVVANTNYLALGEDPEPIIYLSFFQAPSFGLTFVVESRPGAPLATAEVQRVVHEVNPDIAFSGIRSVADTVETQIGTYRMGARAVGLFAVLAAVLSALGLYGVLSFLVAAETREIGVRIALGATAAEVTLQVVRSGIILAGGGVALGLGLALALTRGLATMLYRVSPYDPVSFVTVPVLLLGVAALASLIPARRASRVDPMEALRLE